MNVTINFDTNQAEDLKALKCMFGAFLGAGVVPVTITGNAPTAVVPAATEPAKPKGGRGKKTETQETPATTPAPDSTTAPAEVAKAAVEVATTGNGTTPATPAAPVQAEADPFGATAPSDPAAPVATGGPDLETVRKRVLAVAQKVDAKIVTDKLETVTGVRRASDIPPAKFAEALAMLDSLEAAADLAG